jgi:hypothetical protein
MTTLGVRATNEIVEATKRFMKAIGYRYDAATGSKSSWMSIPVSAQCSGSSSARTASTLPERSIST